MSKTFSLLATLIFSLGTFFFLLLKLKTSEKVESCKIRKNLESNAARWASETHIHPENAYKKFVVHYWNGGSYKAFVFVVFGANSCWSYRACTARKYPFLVTQADTHTHTLNVELFLHSPFILFIYVTLLCTLHYIKYIIFISIGIVYVSASIGSMHYKVYIIVIHYTYSCGNFNNVVFLDSHSSIHLSAHRLGDIYGHSAPLT